MQKQRKSEPENPILALARPQKKTRFRAKIVEGVAILEGENGELAVVAVDEVCRLAARLNLVVEGVKC